MTTEERLTRLERKNRRLTLVLIFAGTQLPCWLCWRLLAAQGNRMQTPCAQSVAARKFAYRPRRQVAR